MKTSPKDKLICKLLAALEGLGNDRWARIDARVLYPYFLRRAKKLKIKVAPGRKRE